MERKLDLIDRNALYEKAYFHGKLPDPGNLYPDGKEAVDVDDIDDAPSIDAMEVVHGQWLPIYCGDRLVGGKCSVCGKFKKLSSMKMLYEQYKFCHKCGSKMDGKNNGK